MPLCKPIIGAITCCATAPTNDEWFPKSGIAYAQTLDQLRPCHGFYITHMVGIEDTSWTRLCSGFIEWEQKAWEVIWGLAGPKRHHATGKMTWKFFMDLEAAISGVFAQSRDISHMDIKKEFTKHNEWTELGMIMTKNKLIITIYSLKKSFKKTMLLPSTEKCKMSDIEKTVPPNLLWIWHLWSLIMLNNR